MLNISVFRINMKDLIFYDVHLFILLYIVWPFYTEVGKV